MPVWRGSDQICVRRANGPIEGFLVHRLQHPPADWQSVFKLGRLDPKNTGGACASRMKTLPKPENGCFGWQAGATPRAEAGLRHIRTAQTHRRRFFSLAMIPGRLRDSFRGSIAVLLDESEKGRAGFMRPPPSRRPARGYLSRPRHPEIVVGKICRPPRRPSVYHEGESRNVPGTCSALGWALVGLTVKSGSR